VIIISKLDQKPSILFVGNHPSSSKNYISASELIAYHLRNRSWNINLTSKKKSKFFSFIDKIFTIFFKRKSYQIAVVDVFSKRAFVWGYICTWILKKINKTTILVLRGGDLPNFYQKFPGKFKNLFSWPKVIVAPSEYLKDNLPTINNEIVVIPNGIQILDYPYYGKEKVKPKLIWLRAFHSIYNPLLVPGVIDLLIDDDIKVYCSMVGPDRGDGSLKAVRNEIEKLNLEEFIEIIPGVSKSEVPNLLSTGDIFLNTTNIDNTPTSVIEALACGLCVVSTNVGGIPYLLDDGVNALLVPPNNSVMMVKSIKRILTEPELFQKLSKNARRDAERYDWSKIIPMWENLFITTYHSTFSNFS